MVNKMLYKKRDNPPLHKHPNKQSGYVISRRYRIVIDNVEREIGPGDSYSIPRDVKHCIKIIKPDEMLDFSVHQERTIYSEQPANTSGGLQPAGDLHTDESTKELILFYKVDESGYKEVLPGIRLKTLVYGEKTLFSEFRMEANTVLPQHFHSYEQTGYLVQGRIRLTIGQQTFEASPGDSWCIPSNIDHGAEILEKSVAIEVFSPVREDYLPEKK